jgi:hypothetical protein
MVRDFIPHSDGAFWEQANTFISYVSACVRFFGIPQEAVTLIQNQFNAYNRAFEAIQEPFHTIEEISLYNAEKETLRVSLQTFIQAYVTYNPRVSGLDRERMGLPLRSQRGFPPGIQLPLGISTTLIPARKTTKGGTRFLMKPAQSED